MSATLGLTNPYLFTIQNSPTSRLTQFQLTAVVSPTIKGHPIQEVRVSTHQHKVLPMPIQISHKRMPEDAKSPKSLRSTMNSPIGSPRSYRSTRTNHFSPKSVRLHDTGKIETFQLKQSGNARELSPRQDISELLRNSLKIQEKKTKELKQKYDNEMKTKQLKRLQRKEYDSKLRDENLKRFKQRIASPRPKWGIDDKKIILDTKTLREAEISKKHKVEKKSMSFDIFKSNKTKKKHQKPQPSNMVTHKINLRLESPEDAFSKQKDEIYKQILILDDRVNKCKTQATLSANTTFEKTQSAIKIQAHVRGFLIRRAMKKYFESTSKESSSRNTPSKNPSISFEDQNEEVQGIMRGTNPAQSPPLHSNPHQDPNKSYERMLASQMKIKIKQQQQLTELRAKDLNEMNKLAEVLGGNEEMKEKFQCMIDRRYSKLVNLFEENIDNIKQVLGYGEITETNLVANLLELSRNCNQNDNPRSESRTPAEDPLRSLRNTTSEFSSSFLDQLKGVPNSFPADLTFEPGPDEAKEDYIDSPEENSVYSRDTCTEPSSANVSFPQLCRPGSLQISQEEPNVPLISESFSENPAGIPQEKSEEGALISLVADIKPKNSPEESKDSDTLNLTDEKSKVKVASPILIYEESFSSNESGVLGEYSSILASPVAESNHEFPSTEHSKSKPLRNIVENFPHNKELSPFTAAFESSTEHDGFELIINRVLLTLEIYVFSGVYEEALNRQEVLEMIAMARPEKRRRIPIKGRDSMLSIENQVQTDQIAVLSFIKKLQLLKNDSEIVEKLKKIYSPMLMLSRIQENFEESQEDFQIFDSDDLDKAEQSNNSYDPLGISNSDLQLYVQIHNKMILDVLNEAILRSSKNRFTMPWSFEKPLLEKVEAAPVLKASVKKILKWGEVEAGKVPSSDMITSNGELDEDRLQDVRENKLAMILVMDVAEGDKSWIECDFEEGQVGIDVAEWVLSELYRELIDIIIK